MKKLVLDAGHGLYTPGKRTPDGIHEWSLNNAVCNYITEYLKGYNVVVYRTDDTTGKEDIPLKTRRNKTNTINPNLFISIHHNALTGAWGNHSGVEVYTHTLGSAEDRKVAEIILPKLVNSTGIKSRGTKKALFYVLGCKSSIPAVLVEGGFMDSNNDYKIITTEDGQRKYGRAIADAVIEYLGLTKTSGEATPTPPAKPVVNSEVFKVKITTDTLRVRAEPNTSSRITDRVHKGEIYTIVEQVNGWGKLKSGAGWISLEYTTRNINSYIPVVKPNKPTYKPSYVLGRYKTTANLNVRAGAGTGYRVIKTYSKGTVFDTWQVQGNWAKTPSGWVCLDYATLIYKY